MGSIAAEQVAKLGRPRIRTDAERKLIKALEQRRRRASPEGKEWSKNYYQRPEVKARKKATSQLPKHRDWIRDWELRKDFGITLVQYNEMWEKQKGLCAICGGTEKNRRLSVDHNHNTSKVRGLLCGACNRGIGMFKDNPELFKKAVVYLVCI